MRTLKLKDGRDFKWNYGHDIGVIHFYPNDTYWIDARFDTEIVEKKYVLKGILYSRVINRQEKAVYSDTINADIEEFVEWYNEQK